jgi:TRAP-type C4-dicarboxylate transport system permease small subunit
MKPSFYNKIPAIVLWVCMLVTIAITVWFFIDYVVEADNGDTDGTSALIYWLYVVLIAAFIAMVGDILRSHFKKMK